MKNFAAISLALTAVYLSTLAASTDSLLNLRAEQTHSQSPWIVNVYHLTDQDLNEMMQGSRPEMVIEFPAQTYLPIHFFLRGDLFNLIEDKQKNLIEIKQTVYVRCMPEGLMASTNLTNWKPFLELMTGTASLSLSIQVGQPALAVGMEANIRS